MRANSKGIGGHQSAKSGTDEWLTPPYITNALGVFDLDPCAPLEWKRHFTTANKYYTIEDDRLSKDWEGRVWLNPPYGRLAEAWMKKMGKHDNGIALLFARTETVMFQNYIFPAAASMLFVEGRPHFHVAVDTYFKRKDKDGNDIEPIFVAAGEAAPANSGAPVVLVSYGDENVEAIEKSGIKGKHVLINRATAIVITVSPSWQHVVRIALVKLGAKAELNSIYEMVEAIAPDKVETNSHYKEKIVTKENCQNNQTIIYVKDDPFGVIDKVDIYLFKDDRIVMDNQGRSICGTEWMYSQLSCIQPIPLSSLIDDKVKELVGELKEGEHPDEINPRSGTWLEERRSWQAEVKQLQEHIKKLENG